MFKFLLTLLLMVGLLTVPLQAQVLPGTNITRPNIDIQCDAARDAKDYSNEINLCIKAAAAYDGIVNQLIDYKKLANKNYLIEEMRYDKALSLFEVASAYHSLGDDTNGHVYAVNVYKVYNISRMYFWAKLNAASGRKLDNTNPIDFKTESSKVQEQLNSALTEDDLKLIKNYSVLLHYVNELYTDITNINT